MFNIENEILKGISSVANGIAQAIIPHHRLHTLEDQRDSSEPCDSSESSEPCDSSESTSNPVPPYSTPIPRKLKEDDACSFTKDELSVWKAYGEEVHMFLHVHLRGYDREGNGQHMDGSYYDKYGAPVLSEESWMEGYHTVEMTLAEHIDHCCNEGMEFPLVAGMAGAVHLYKPIHDAEENDQPWNWSGWVPVQKRWLCDGRFFYNRHFLALRGNEIQNNLWDYHPYKDHDFGEEVDELDYSQIQPLNKYQGGYFFHGNAFGRYLHLISLKSHDPKSNTSYKKYNYIVHPLAYRTALNDLPDNSVDAMQWSIINIANEEHFGDGQPWGKRVHGLEIFNDFTYFKSYEPQSDNGINNGEVEHGKVGEVEGKSSYIYWFNSYPLEFGEFLLDSALSSGVHFHTLTANDAFYKRRALPPGSDSHESDNNHQKSEKVLLSDPKAAIVRRRIQDAEQIALSHYPTKKEKKMLPLLNNPEVKESLAFLNTRPYRCNTAFGYTTLIDTRKILKSAVFCDVPKTKMRAHGLDNGEFLAMDYLIEGQFYSHTALSGT